MNRPLWITQEIFRAIRERKRLLKLFRATRNSDTFRLLCVARNEVNTMVDYAVPILLRINFVKMLKILRNSGNVLTG